MHMCDNRDRTRKKCKIKLKENKRGKQIKTRPRRRSKIKNESRRGKMFNA